MDDDCGNTMDDDSGSTVDDDCGNQDNTADEKDFPLSVSSVKAALKTLINPSGDQPSSQPVVWDGSDSYLTDRGRRGIALVIINETFRGHKGRAGSQLDADNLCNTFSMLGFEVRLAKDCSRRELKNILEQVAAEDHSDSDCFVFAISSHGDEMFEDKKSPQVKTKVREDVVFCTDFYMTTKALVLHFTDDACPSLKGKPRLFFLQACRGVELDAGLEVQVIHPAQDVVDGMSEQPEVIVSPAPCFKDFLIMCATPPGYYAFRRPSDGSWFVLALCSVLQKCDGSRDVLQLLTRVINKVAQDFMSRTPLVPENDKKKQTPCIYSMLTKDLYWKVREERGKILTWQ